MRKFLVFVYSVEAIIYLLLYSLHDCTFKQEECQFLCKALFLSFTVDEYILF